MKKGIDEIIISGYGWITSHGEFYAVDQYYHIEGVEKIIKDSPFEHERIAQFLTAYHDQLSKQEKECQKLSDENGGLIHGAWHNYELLEYSLYRKFIETIYDCGWVRVGKHFVMGIEGTPKGIKARYYDIKKLEDELNLDNAIEYYKVK
jgi:hypothetical protein